MKRISILLMLLLATTDVMAANWVGVAVSDGDDGNKVEFFYDSESLKISRNLRYAWTKASSQKKTEHGAGEESSKIVDYVVTKLLYDCDGETSRLMAMNWHYTDGSFHQADVRGAASFPEEPDTVGYLVLKAICSIKR